MGKARLLITEDDVDISNMLKIYFGGLGYDVDTAMRGSEALEKTRQVLPHLIVLDIEWFGDVVVSPKFETLQAVAALVFLGKEDDRNVTGTGIRTQSAANLVTVDIREHDIEHDQVRQNLACLLQGF